MFDNQALNQAHPRTLGLDPDAKPMRIVPRRNYHHEFDGDGGDFKAIGRSIPFRTLLERDLRTLLCADPMVDCYAIECHQLTYYVPDGSGDFVKHVYTPDVVALSVKQKLSVLDSKASAFANDPTWLALKTHIEEAYWRDYRVRFLVPEESDIRRQPRLNNAQIMLRHSYFADDKEALFRVRKIMGSRKAPITIGEIVVSAELLSEPGTCRAFSAIMNLALRGEIDIDHSMPINDDMLIKGFVS